MRKVTFVLVAGACLWVPSAGARPRAAAVHGCSVRGLSYSYRSGTSTEADKVAQLKTTRVSCPSARSLAGTVAKKLLHNRKVPSTIDGLQVRVKSPCAGCTPDWSVTASSKSAEVTFHVLGGTR